MIDEERLGYIGSIVLGLNDSLVELTGSLAGFTLSLQNTRLIGTAGLITGIAAALSMSSSEYLSQKSERGTGSPVRASLYTGTAYLLTVVVLVIPYFIFVDYYLTLATAIAETILIILVFMFFLSVVRELPFRKTVLQMLIITLGVTGITFTIGWVVKTFLNLQI